MNATAQLEELYDLLRIPSVSADPNHAADVRRAGEWVRDLVRSAKGAEAELVDTDAQPMVIGEIPASNDPGNAPTVLIYGHFDVQPPAPIDLWDSDPFEPTVKDDWLFARGVADDKGQLYSILRAAVDLADEGALPEDSTTKPAVPDAFGYRLSYGGDTVTTDDPGMPKALRGLVARLGALVDRYGR